MSDELRKRISNLKSAGYGDWPAEELFSAISQDEEMSGLIVEIYNLLGKDVSEFLELAKEHLKHIREKLMSGE